MMVDTVAFSEIHNRFDHGRQNVGDMLKNAVEIAYEISVFNERRQFNYFEFMHKFFCEFIPEQNYLTCYDIGIVTEIISTYLSNAITIPMDNKRC